MKLGFFGWCFVIVDAAVQAYAMSHHIEPLLFAAAVVPALLNGLSVASLKN